MSHDFRGVLALIADDAAEADAVVERSVRLAEQAHGRLTIAALACPDVRRTWLAGLALMGTCLAPRQSNCVTVAQHRLARVAEFIPVTIGLTTLIIGEPPRAPVRRLLASGRYDLLVIGARLAGRRAFAHLAVPALVVPAGVPARARRAVLNP
jgi:hypothetical protein